MSISISKREFCKISILNCIDNDFASNTPSWQWKDDNMSRWWGFKRNLVIRAWSSRPLVVPRILYYRPLCYYVFPYYYVLCGPYYLYLFYGPLCCPTSLLTSSSVCVIMKLFCLNSLVKWHWWLNYVALHPLIDTAIFAAPMYIRELPGKVWKPARTI